MKRKLILIQLFLFIVLTGGFAQRKKKYVDSKEIGKMNKIEIQIGKRMLPKAYLYRVKNDSLDLFCKVSDLKDESTVYSELKLAVRDLDYIKVTDRKAKIKFALISGLAFGIAGYAIANKATENDDANDNINLIQQGDSNNTIESVLGGITGFGFGVIIGNHFGGKREFTKRQKEKYIVKELKKYAYR